MVPDCAPRLYQLRLPGRANPNSVTVCTTGCWGGQTPPADQLPWAMQSPWAPRARQQHYSWKHCWEWQTLLSSAGSTLPTWLPALQQSPSSGCEAPPSPEAAAEAGRAVLTPRLSPACWAPVGRTEVRGGTHVTDTSGGLTAKPGWGSGSKRWERVRNTSSARWVQTWRAPGASTESSEHTPPTTWSPLEFYFTRPAFLLCLWSRLFVSRSSASKLPLSLSRRKSLCWESESLSEWLAEGVSEPWLAGDEDLEGDSKNFLIEGWLRIVASHDLVPCNEEVRKIWPLFPQEDLATISPQPR